MKRRRKTRSDKFPLILHPTGQYCKKIKGKIAHQEMYTFSSEQGSVIMSNLVSKNSGALHREKIRLGELHF